MFWLYQSEQWTIIQVKIDTICYLLWTSKWFANDFFTHAIWKSRKHLVRTQCEQYVLHLGFYRWSNLAVMQLPCVLNFMLADIHNGQFSIGNAIESMMIMMMMMMAIMPVHSRRKTHKPLVNSIYLTNYCNKTRSKRESFNF